MEARTVKFGGRVPLELRARRQWVLWNRETVAGRPTKIPYLASAPTVRASSTDPASWDTFECAIAHIDDADGIGFTFSGDDPYCGLDFDRCVANGHLHPAALKFAKELDSYTELSPSRTGIHIVVRGRLGGTRHTTGNTPWGGQFEAYDWKRFFTVTGNQLHGTTIEDRQEQLDRVVAELLPPRADNGAGDRKSSAPEALGLDDEQLLEKARQSRNGGDFDRLWRGDTSGHKSDSEADLALCGALAFWCGPDPGRIDRLFRQSGLMRPKWNSRRGDTTWGAQTIDRALEGRVDFYVPKAAEAVTTVTTGRPDRPFALSLDDFIAAKSDTPPALIGDEDDCVLPAHGAAAADRQGRQRQEHTYRRAVVPPGVRGRLVGVQRRPAFERVVHRERGTPGAVPPKGRAVPGRVVPRNQGRHLHLRPGLGCGPARHPGVCGSPQPVCGRPPD